MSVSLRALFSPRALRNAMAQIVELEQNLWRMGGFPSGAAEPRGAGPFFLSAETTQQNDVA
jgi:hypothetical protein